MRRVSESLHAHIRSTSARTGKMVAATVRLPLCKTSKAKSESCASLECGGLTPLSNSLSLPIGDKAPSSRRTPNQNHRSERATCSTILRNSLKRSSSVELNSDRFALITQSYRRWSTFISLPLRRKTSRNSRRARFRSTDFPIAFVEAVKPSRWSGKSF